MQASQGNYVTTVFAYRSTAQGRRLVPVGEERHPAEEDACAAARRALLCTGVGATVAVAGAGRGAARPLHRFGLLPARRGVQRRRANARAMPGTA